MLQITLKSNKTSFIATLALLAGATFAATFVKALTADPLLEKKDANLTEVEEDEVEGRLEEEED